MPIFKLRILHFAFVFWWYTLSEPRAKATRRQDEEWTNNGRRTDEELVGHNRVTYSFIIGYDLLSNKIVTLLIKKQIVTDDTCLINQRVNSPPLATNKINFPDLIPRCLRRGASFLNSKI